MNTTLAATMGLLVVAFNVAGASAQEIARESASSRVKEAQARFQLCTASDKTDIAERLALQTYTSPALEKALLSSKTFWDFITDPSTPYMDRMAAANRGGPILSPADLPILWQAMAEIDWVPSGVNPMPCSCAMALEVPRKQSVRMVLGHQVQLPAKNVDYPVTAEERDHSPWIWQMERALSLLFDKSNRYYGDLERYPARVKAAWDLPISVPTYRPGEVLRNPDPAEWTKINIRSRALTEIAPQSLLQLQTILRLALNNDNNEVADGAFLNDLRAWGQDSYQVEELAHVAQIAILRKTKWENVAGETAFVTAARFARSKRDPVNTSNIVPLDAATAILSIGRWATDKSLSPWNRYYSFVSPICRIVDDPPFPPDQIRDPKDPRLDESLRTFEAWFEKKKPALEKQSATERPHLESLAKELGTDIE